MEAKIVEFQQKFILSYFIDFSKLRVTYKVKFTAFTEKLNTGVSPPVILVLLPLYDLSDDDDHNDGARY